MGIIQTLCLDILILAHEVQIQMILDEVNFRSQQQVLVIMTLLILRFAHKEIRAILPLFGQDRSSYRLVVIRPVSLQVHRHQRNVPGSRQGIVVAGKWLQTAIAVTRLKAVGILAQLAQVGKAWDV